MCQLLEQCLGLPALPSALRPDLLLSPTMLHVGKATIPRRQRSKAATDYVQPVMGRRQTQLGLLHHQMEYLECVAKCVQHGWPCCVVGGSCSGKTSLIRVLAKLSGQRLNEIALTGSTDTSDLLGGFEQMDARRKIQQVRSAFVRLSFKFFLSSNNCYHCHQLC